MSYHLVLNLVLELPTSREALPLFKLGTIVVLHDGQLGSPAI